MFGFFGVLAAFGLLALLRRHRGYRYLGYGCGPRGWHHPQYSLEPWHHHPWDRSDGHRHGYGYGPRNRWLDFLLARLDVTPDQASVIRTEMAEFLHHKTEIRDHLRAARDDIATAMRDDSFDATAMGESFAKQDDVIEDFRKRIVGSLARIHDVLEPEQRQRLADLLQRRGGRWGFGPYRA